MCTVFMIAAAAAALPARRCQEPVRAGAAAGPSLPISSRIAKLYYMKTTIDINDSLLARAKRHARKTGKPLRVIVEEGLRHVLESQQERSAYKLPDRAAGAPGGPNPLERYTWQDLRHEIYGGR
jgi:Arc/MetJ family transcription regulator